MRKIICILLLLVLLCSLLTGCSFVSQSPSEDIQPEIEIEQQDTQEDNLDEFEDYFLWKDYFIFITSGWGPNLDKNSDSSFNITLVYVADSSTKEKGFGFATTNIYDAMELVKDTVLTNAQGEIYNPGDLLANNSQIIIPYISVPKDIDPATLIFKLDEQTTINCGDYIVPDMVW
jgi:hypothetical protein